MLVLPVSGSPLASFGILPIFRFQLLNIRLICNLRREKIQQTEVKLSRLPNSLLNFTAAPTIHANEAFSTPFARHIGA